MNELISMVVPVYNVEQYLDACLISILNQTYKHLEIILVDDGSTDRSGQICDDYAKKDKRINVVHKKNGGLSDARNHGINQGSGRYIVFVDGDDVISRDYVKCLYQLIKENPCDIGICDCIHCYSQKEIDFCPAKKTVFYTAENAIRELLYQKRFLVSAWGKIFPREYFYDLSFPLGRLYEDSSIMYLLFEKSNLIAYSDAKLYGYFHHEGSITTHKFNKKNMDIIKISEEIYKHYADKIKLKKAARAYLVNAALRIYLTCPDNQKMRPYKKYVQGILRREGYKVLADVCIRRKTRIALMLYYLARPCMRKVYKHIGRWG